MKPSQKIVGGPSKFDIMLGLFENKVLLFKGIHGNEFYVRAVRVQVLDDQGDDAWSIKGYIVDKNGKSHNLSVCSVLFSGRTREGMFSDLGPDDKKRYNFEYLATLPDRELVSETACEQKVAFGFKEQIDELLKNLNPHDRRVAELYAAQKMASVTVDIVMSCGMHFSKSKKVQKNS